MCSAYDDDDFKRVIELRKALREAEHAGQTTLQAHLRKAIKQAKAEFIEQKRKSAALAQEHMLRCEEDLDDEVHGEGLGDGLPDDPVEELIAIGSSDSGEQPVQLAAKNAKKAEVSYKPGEDCPYTDYTSLYPTTLKYISPEPTTVNKYISPERSPPKTPSTPKTPKKLPSPEKWIKPGDYPTAAKIPASRIASRKNKAAQNAAFGKMQEKPKTPKTPVSQTSPPFIEVEDYPYR